ncbi:hypothetical protein O0882_10595 [Janthinobacterium sp. SUN073]|uniref:hypothetical protein n=1 Tax=Janthinobacterium sp. SUN073 TaxID=3004102 RepID=UPI0025B07573|nr:hypothetical protein [Janthinobacterium sp. SUN073]MDN2696769.1 hypothetical protein [Janthinobacterium sp. SUN073]
MCDECNPFERLVAKADAAYRRLRSIRWDQWLRYVEDVSPALAKAMRHTGIGIASGLFTGLILFGLQFTSDQPVNAMAKSLQCKFIVHYQDIPGPLFNLVLFLVACTMLLTAEWGHFFRQKVLVPVIHGISHTVSITTGMLLSLVFSEVLTKSFLPNIRPWLGSLLIILAVWLLAVTMNAVIYLCRYGMVGLWRKKNCAEEECPAPQKKYEVLHFIFPLVGIFLIFYLWGDVKRSAVQVADGAKASEVAACEVAH